MFPTAKDGHLNILFRWVRYSSKFHLGDILKKHNIYKIAIYGGGALGIALYENLAGSMDIKFIIDRNPDLSFPYNGVQTIQPQQTDFLYELDAVIVTIDYDNVEKRLNPYVRCLSLADLMIDIDDYYLLDKVIQHAKTSGVTVLFADLTKPACRIKNPSFFEQVIAMEGVSGVSAHDMLGEDILLSYYDDLDCCSVEYCEKVVNAPVTIINKGGITYLNDVTSEYYNVTNHCRLTTDMPDKYDNMIHLFGHCAVRGANTEDQYTVASYLQRMLNNATQEGYNSRGFRVVNRATGAAIPNKEYFLRILDTPFRAGDYIVLISAGQSVFKFYYEENEIIKYIDFYNVFNRPHEYSGEIFFDKWHMNHRGYGMIAKKIYSELEQLFNVEVSVGAVDNSVGRAKQKNGGFDFSHLFLKKNINSSEYRGLEEYLNLLRKEKVDISGAIGSVVMNCNPFTLGHRYLIEEAKKNCDFLYI